VPAIANVCRSRRHTLPDQVSAIAHRARFGVLFSQPNRAAPSIKHLRMARVEKDGHSPIDVRIVEQANGYWIDSVA